MAKSILQKHYHRILTHWPTDLLRPEISFQKTLRHRIDDARFEPSSSPTSSSPTAPEQDNVKANQALATIVPPTTTKRVALDDEKGELEQVNVLYSFLENRYMKRYPLSEKMLKPLSNPKYYENLLKELDEAPRRSWLQSRLNRWKGFLRFS